MTLHKSLSGLAILGRLDKPDAPSTSSSMAIVPMAQEAETSQTTKEKWLQSNLLPAKEVIKDVGAVMDAQVHHGCSLSLLFILLENLYNSGIDFEARNYH